LNWIAGLFGSACGEISGQATAPSITLPTPSASDLGAISHYPASAVATMKHSRSVAF